MEILHIAAEAVPFAKTGGLADVAGVLPRVMAGSETVSLMVPEYITEAIRASAPEVVDSFAVQVGCRSIPVAVKKTEVSPRFSVFFISQDRFFAREFLYGDARGDYPDNFYRFLFFQKAAVEFVRRQKMPFDIIHCHDWQAALVPLLAKFPETSPFMLNTRFVFSIHNLGYQGIFAGNLFEATGLPEYLFTPDYLEFFGNLNFMKAGIIFSDRLLTVSPTYAREILKPEKGFGLDGLLNKFSFKLSGILNGVDYSHWDPESDRFIDQPYSRQTLGLKSRNKEALYAELKIPADPQMPLLVLISRIAEQKGIQLLLNVFPELVNEKLYVIILGEGDRDLTEKLRAMVGRFSKKSTFLNSFDDRMAHRLKAAADMFFMPSLYEPCGLNQIYSMKYGTVPIVRATGGLEDSIDEFDPRSGQGTGFKFSGDKVSEIMPIIKKVLSLYENPKAWRRIQENGMAQDFSWERVVPEYIKVYNEILREDCNHG